MLRFQNYEMERRLVDCLIYRQYIFVDKKGKENTKDMQVQTELFHLIEENYLGRKSIILSEETDLIRDLGMDSVAIMQMIAEVEDHFQICFDDVDLLIENFSPLGKFSRLIEATMQSCHVK